MSEEENLEKVRDIVKYCRDICSDYGEWSTYVIFNYEDTAYNTKFFTSKGER